MKNKTTNKIMIATAAAVLCFSPQTSATALTSGGSTSSLTAYNSAASNPYTGTFVAGSTASLSNSLWTGVVKSAVFRSAAGTLDFLYQVTVNGGSTAAITNLVETSFTGYTTDTSIITYDFDGIGSSSVNFSAGSGFKSPAAISRSADGGTLTVDFGMANAVTAANSSWTVVLQTNSVQFGVGGLQAVDNRLSYDPFTSAYQPYGPAVPEPATFALIGFGLAILGLIRRK